MTKGLVAGLLITILLLAGILPGSGCNESSNLIDMYQGTGSMVYDSVELECHEGKTSFEVRHSADEGFVSWSLYYPFVGETLVATNKGLEGTETVSFNHPISISPRAVFALEVFAANECTWSIEILD
ncbi:MAG: hypothetical protein SVY53_15740 [Chloroflexota bacterium]|nr:hypothetical protein [Chloroflexota bacterium]